MDNYLEAKLVIKREKDEKKPFSYNIIDSHNGRLFFVDFLFRFLNKDNPALKWNKDDKLNENDGDHIRLILHTPKDILTGYASSGNVNDFAQIDFIQEKTSVRKDKIPILHLVLTDIFVKSLYDGDTLPASVPRSFQIMDNSIWNYLVPFCNVTDINKDGNKETLYFKDNFYNAVESIERNYKKNLYSLSVAKEYADLNARLAKEAFVAGSHAKGVSPFIFHSENSIQRMIKKEFVGEDNVIKKIADQKWRILLVDDKAVESMSNDKKYKENYSWSCKLVIIINLFSKFLEKYAPNKKIACQINGIPVLLDENLRLNKKKDGQDKITIIFEYAQNIDDAENALKSKKFDLVLLDYYLEKDKSGKQSYGTTLLESVYTYVSTQKSVETFLSLKKEDIKKEINRIFDTKDIKYEELRKYIYKKGHEDLKFLYDTKDINLVDKVCEKIKEEEKLGTGPNGRHLFMFISAYSSAVHERLLAEGLNQSEKYWFISVGACPTNTPQLFLYNLIKLMDKRLEDSGILKLSSDEIYKLVNNIYLPKEQDSKGDSIRKRANALYQKVLSLQYHYRSILKDVEIPFGQNASDFDTKGSVLMTHFIQNKINLGGMLEHLTQLVHLTAFGTVRQWPDMWEEYIYFKAQFEKQLDGVSIDNFRNLCENIEDYILKLKSQQR